MLRPTSGFEDFVDVKEDAESEEMVRDLIIFVLLNENKELEPLAL